MNVAAQKAKPTQQGGQMPNVAADQDTNPWAEINAPTPPGGATPQAATAKPKPQDANVETWDTGKMATVDEKNLWANWSPTQESGKPTRNTTSSGSSDPWTNKSSSWNSSTYGWGKKSDKSDKDGGSEKGSGRGKDQKGNGVKESPRQKSKTACKNLMTGFGCKHGDGCWFSQDPKTIAATQLAEAKRASVADAKDAQGGAGKTAQEEDEPKEDDDNGRSQTGHQAGSGSQPSDGQRQPAAPTSQPASGGQYVAPNKPTWSRWTWFNWPASTPEVRK